MNQLPLLHVFLALLAGLVSFPSAGHAAPGPAQSPGALQIHSTRGLVREIAPDRRQTVIRHEAIPNYMPAMTMALTVRDPAELRDIKVGDTVTFRLLADDTTHWIDTIRRVAPAGTNAANPTPASPPAATGSPGKSAVELKPGDLLPDCEFVSETGERIALSRFRGQAVAVTFIFTRCPLPDYCPLMNRNFSEARRLLRADAQSPTNWQFLSVSFDPEHDTPAVLRRHAAVYRRDLADRWLFATASADVLRELAPRVDLMLQREGGSIAHNLRTIVLDPRGRIHRQFDGNRWKAAELAESLREAARIR